MKGFIAGIACIIILVNATSTLAVSDEELKSALKATSQPPETAPVAATSATDQEQVLLEFDVYRVRGNISISRVSLDKTDMRTNGVGRPLPQAEVREGNFIVFRFGELTVAGVKFRADKNGWSWEAKDMPPRGKGVEKIASPKVIVLLGESFKIAIGSQQPIEFFEKRPDGLFELKKLDAETGLSISARVERWEGEPERILLRDLTIGLRSIEKRVPIEGVGLDVGCPIVEAREHKTTIHLEPGSHGIVLGTEGYGNLLIRLGIHLVSPGKMDAILNTSVTDQ